MRPRAFWIAAPLVLVGLAFGAWLLAPEESFTAVAATLVANFAGACVGAALLLMLGPGPASIMAATLGRSAVSVLGVVLVWLLLEPSAKPVLGAFAVGYLVFLVLETALAWGLNRERVGDS